MASSHPWRALLVAGALLLLPTASARAATVSYTAEGVLLYTATAGPDAPSIDLGDPGDPVRFDGDSDVTSAPAACTVSGGAAACPVDPAKGVAVDLGDGDDSPVVLDGATRALPLLLDGGAGNDRLTGAPLDGGGETLQGGPGDDRLDGLAGADRLDGGDGNDALSGDAGADALDGGAGDDKLVGDGTAARSADAIDGGPGRDAVEDWSYAGAAPITLTLGGGADDGFGGEGDDVRGVEAVWTTSPGRLVGTDAPEQLFANNGAATLEGRGGDDELRAADGSDTLLGEAGADKLVGNAGDDRLVGGPGPDTIIADVETEVCSRYTCGATSGNDLVEARDGEVDSVTCGPGADRVVADAGDVVAGDCETVDRGVAPTTPPQAPTPAKTKAKPKATVRPRVRVARTSLRTALAKGLKVTYSGVAPGRRALTVTYGGRRMARVTVKVRTRGSATVRVRLTRTARATLRHRRSATLRVGIGGARTTVKIKA